MGKKTSPVKGAFKAIKAKLKTTSSTRNFTQKLHDSLTTWVTPHLKQGFDWLDDKISIKGETNGKTRLLLPLLLQL